MATQLNDVTSTTNTIELMRESIKASGYKGDLSDSSPVFQHLLAPNSVLFETQLQQQDAIRNSWTLLSKESTEEITVDDEVLINLFNNIRLYPSSGKKSTGSVKLNFSTNDIRTIKLEDVFVSPSGDEFYPDQNYYLVPSEGYRRSSRSSDIVYTEEYSDGSYSAAITLVSKESKPVSVPSGAGFSTTIQGLESTTALESFEAGFSKSTVSELVKDVPLTLTETSLASVLGIHNYLRSNFPQIADTAIIRSGDDEMTRDPYNPLGVASPAADVVLATTTAPQIKRVNLTGYVNLTVTPQGDVYNSNTLYCLQDDVFTTLPGTETEFQVVCSIQPSQGLYGAILPTAGGLIEEASQSEADSNLAKYIPDGIQVVSRGVVQDDTYGSYIPRGSRKTDFSFSAYQASIDVTYTKSVLLIDSDDLTHKVSAWMQYWAVYRDTTMDATLRASRLAWYTAQYGETPPIELNYPVESFVDLLYYPTLYDIQLSLNTSDKAVLGQDYLVKAPYVQLVDVRLQLDANLDYVKYREDHFKTQIANLINNQDMLSSKIAGSEIKALVMADVPNGSKTDGEVTFTSRIQLANDSSMLFTSGNLEKPNDTEFGISFRNTVFFTDSSNITFSYL